jgi:hypothetical protein
VAGAVCVRTMPWCLGSVCPGMSAGVPDYVTVNLSDLEKFGEGEEVTLEALQAKRVFTISGRSKKLPLKVGVRVRARAEFFLGGVSCRGWVVAPRTEAPFAEPGQTGSSIILVCHS